MEILNRAKPLDEVIAQSDDARLQHRLERVQSIRAYASRELGLPDNGSYRATPISAGHSWCGTCLRHRSFR